MLSYVDNTPLLKYIYIYMQLYSRQSTQALVRIPIHLHHFVLTSTVPASPATSTPGESLLIILATIRTMSHTAASLAVPATGCIGRRPSSPKEHGPQLAVLTTPHAQPHGRRARYRHGEPPKRTARHLPRVERRYDEVDDV